MTENLPLVTLALPVYNGEPTLAKSLESLVSQTYPNFEIIISDDNSTDNTAKISKKFSKKYDFISFKQNKENLGEDGYGNLRSIISIANGEYIAWVCQDDLWEPNFVNDLMLILHENPNAVAAMSALDYTLENNGEVHKRPHVMHSPKNWPQNNSCFANTLRLIFYSGVMTSLRMNKTPEFSFRHFIHGIVKTDVIDKSLKAMHRRISDEQELLAQWTMAGEMYYLDKVLFYKEVLNVFVSININSEELENTLDKKNIAEHIRRQERKKKFRSLKPSRTKYYAGLMLILLRSEIVPLSRKLLLPVLFVLIMSKVSFVKFRRLFFKGGVNKFYNYFEKK